MFSCRRQGKYALWTWGLLVVRLVCIIYSYSEEAMYTSYSQMLVMVLWALLQNHVDHSHTLECTDRRNLTVSPLHGRDSSQCINTIGNPCKTLSYLLACISNCANVEVLDECRLTESIHFNQSSYQLLILGRGGGGGGGGPIALKCGKNVGLFFHSSRQIHIKNLHFIGCSMNITKFIPPEARINVHPTLSAVIFYEAQDVDVTDCTFTDIVGSSLLLIDVLEATIKGSVFTGNSDLVDSIDSRNGGIIIRRLLQQHSWNTTYTITNCNFTGNRQGNITCPRDNFVVLQDYVGFGGAIDVKLLTNSSSTSVVVEESHFERNTAIYGGAVCMSFSGIDSRNTISFTGCTFESNMACFHGGAIAVRTNINLDLHNESSLGYVSIDRCSFVNNSGYWGGGVSVFRCRDCGQISFSASSSNWEHNNAYSSGFAVSVGGNHTDTGLENRYDIKTFHVVATFSGCNFSRNTNNRYFRNTNAIGALSITSCDITFSGDTLFESNFGTSLLLKGFSRATFAGDVTFRDNFGINGGAIHLVDGSFMRLNQTLNILFVGNLAIVSGGAIYSSPISESFGNHPVPCLFQFGDSYGADNISVTFDSNVASNADQAVFVGNPAQCDHTILLEEFVYMPAIANQVLTVPKEISFTTRPELVNSTLRVMLGEKFFLEPLVTDQFMHNSTSFGYLVLLTDDGNPYSDINSNFTLIGPSSLGIDNYTMNNQFYIQGPDKPLPDLVLQFLYEQTNTYRSGSAEVRIKVVPCKLGYSYSFETQTCECVGSSSIICNLTTVCIQRGYWYDEDGKRAIPCPTRNCNYSDGQCPGSTNECPMSLGYCNISSSDDVCEEGKGRFLCSQCRQNYTFNFGAYRCVPDTTCSALNAFLLTLGVVLYWVLFIAVVLIILTLNLRVGSGFMYGLVYYFSVVTLFTDTSINSSFLTVVSDIAISMTQLDPRMVVEFLPVCFVKGMDNALHHLMLRYVTPVFVTCTILAIIWGSRYCRCPKSISFAEHSPIHAMCMLILFSYTSLTHTSLKILQPIVIGGEINVQASPNTTYFNAKHHLPFALVALFVQFIITLPTCFLLILAPCLSRKLNFVRLRLKPIVDEFQACYRPECRWFAGFYFLARQLMFLASIIPLQDLPQSNLVLQCVSLLVLLIHTSFQPYKERWLNVLDTIFLTDIALFSVYSAVSVSSLQLSGLNRIIFNATPYVLILIPSCYLAIVVCALLIKHFYNWFKSTHMYSQCIPAFRRAPFNRAPTHTSISVAPENYSLSSDEDGEREPLLSDNYSVQSAPVSVHRNRPKMGPVGTSSELLPPWSRSVKNTTH